MENKYAFFDLRYVGDNYYYYKMQLDILKNRIYNEKGFYTISEDEYFYALIYHAILQKKEFANDYKIRLKNMNRTGKLLESEEEFLAVLNKWLLDKGYMITKPIDPTVQFNLENARKCNKLLLGNDLEKNYQLESKMQELVVENERLNKEIEKVITSKSWKIINKVRDFRCKLKK